MIWSTSSIAMSPKISDKHMVLKILLDMNIQPSPGVLVELSPVFLEFLDQVLTELDRELSETCAKEVTCLLPIRYGADGLVRRI